MATIGGKFRRFIPALLLFAFISLIPQTAFADKIYDIYGKVHNGTGISQEGENITLETDLGKITFPRDSVVFVQQGLSPIETYKEMLSLIQPNDAEGHYKLALWCKEKGLNRFIDSEFEKALNANPDYELARLALGYIQVEGKWIKRADYKGELPGSGQVAKKEPRKEQPREIKQPFRFTPKDENQELVADKEPLEWDKAYTRETEHYVVKTDYSKELLDEVCQLMEALNQEYTYRFHIRERMNKFNVFVFRNREGYAEYSSKKAPGAEKYAGYCSTSGEIVTYYQPPNQGGHKALLKILRHEATHQFVNAAVKNRCPVWFNEGMATYFEICRLRGGALINLRKPNQQWLYALKQICKDDKLDLKSLVAKLRGFFERDEYAQSWGIVYYMIIKRPTAFQQYFDALKAGKDPIKSFETVMGEDYPAIEKKLKAFIESIDLNSAVQ